MSEKVLIGIVPRDRFSMFQRCLQAVYAWTDVPFRVVLVAGGADVATKEYIQKLADEKDDCSVAFENRLLLQGEARNLALQQGKERFFVALENDTIVHENWLRPLLVCTQEEGAAVVTPLVLNFWDDSIHVAGCMFDERERSGLMEFHQQEMHAGIKISAVSLQRTKIGYPETHCVLIDRQLLPDDKPFDDVEPFDGDFGLTLQRLGLTTFLEPRSVVTYADPPPLDADDISIFKFRWDADAWAARNRDFVQKWNLVYNGSPKRVFYQRQHQKLGLARWYPNKFNVSICNLCLWLLRVLRANERRLRNSAVRFKTLKYSSVQPR